MKVLLIIPPLTQMNTPYPSTAYLKSFLNSQNIPCLQKDLGIDLLHRIFSPEGLEDIRAEILKNQRLQVESVQFFLEAFEDYKKTIAPVMTFLQGQDSSLALRLSNRKLVPEGPRFIPLQEYNQLLDVFGSMGTQDKAKYIASLYMDDLADVIRASIDPKFEFSKYGEQLASSQNSFDPLLKELSKPTSLLESYMFEILKSYMKDSPDLIGWTVPFPGNVYATLKCSQYLKSHFPDIPILMGGGYVNTELREITDPRLFDFIDYLIFDDGEKPILRLIDVLKNKTTSETLLRTYYRPQANIIKSQSNEKDFSFKEIKAPCYEGLDFKKYLSLLEMPNPMHRMWSDFKWNKLILAHGCYWKKCTFCDTSLDYIGRFEPQKADVILSQMSEVSNTTGSTGFHFVDEAAPPSLLKSLSEKILEHKKTFSWWGNIRFDPQFTPEVAELMSDAGCVAVTGGLEVASPRLLKLINKGITLDQVAKTTRAFKNSGIYVHAYLMYGFPTQTIQETIDSLEVVRQLFKNKCLDSAFWHRFVATVHSPVGQNPENFNVTLQKPIINENFFAINEVPFFDPLEVDHDSLGLGLKKALYNYMHGIGIEEDVRAWFEMPTPKTTIPKTYISKILN